MSNTTVPAGLAGLVTQAPPEDDVVPPATTSSQATSTLQLEEPVCCSEKPRGICRCFFGPRSDKTSNVKLAAVVPAASPPDPVPAGAFSGSAGTGASAGGTYGAAAEPRAPVKLETPVTVAAAGRSPAPQQQKPATESTKARASSPPRQEQVANDSNKNEEAKSSSAKVVHEKRIKETSAQQGEPQLPDQVGQNVGRKTLVLDLDETLVHSSFRAVQSADIVISVELEGENHRVYVRKRPGVDEFMVRVAQLYEVVVYTASMAKYANPLLDELDKKNTITHRLFREACTRHSSGYMKDLSKLGRDLKNVIIIDNSPVCYALQPDNAIPIKTWRDDMSDRELLDLVPILYSLADVDDIPLILKQIVWAADDG